jgi:Uma2 family endonuclease
LPISGIFPRRSSPVNENHPGRVERRRQYNEPNHRPVGGKSVSTVAVLGPKRLKVFLQDQVVIPDWVDDLSSFCRWRLSADAPQRGEISFLDTGIWVDLSREEFLTHNQVKAAVDFAIMSVTQPASLGRHVRDRMLLRNAAANLSTEPDGLFFTWETMGSGRLRLVEKPVSGFLELVGTPDLVMEIVSKTSVDKDTVLLRDLYWRAGIAEYWLIDVRDATRSFEILRATPDRYVATKAVDGWVRSAVLGKRFQLQEKADPLGHPQFIVLSANNS